MIKALLYDSVGRKGRIISFTSAGHSKTEICAATSALIQTVIGIMINMARDNPEHITVVAGNHEGATAMDMICQGRGKEADHAFLDGVVLALNYGLRNLSAQNKEDLVFDYLDGGRPVYSAEGCIKHISAWRAENGILLEEMQAWNLI